MASENTSSLSSTLKGFQESLINKSYKVGIDTKNSETVDIISDYSWIADKAVKAAGTERNNGFNKANRVPFCYVMERKSAANAGIANILNLLNATQQTAGKLIDNVTTVTNMIGKGEISDTITKWR
ncbi:MAG: hypothetical protein IJ341_12565 [Bacteroidales bacterium]|nr:hypothetical protein [Bacteroidales bacterium]